MILHARNALDRWWCVASIALLPFPPHRNRASFVVCCHWLCAYYIYDSFVLFKYVCPCPFLFGWCSSSLLLLLLVYVYIYLVSRFGQYPNKRMHTQSPKHYISHYNTLHTSTYNSNVQPDTNNAWKCIQ